MGTSAARAHELFKTLDRPVGSLPTVEETDRVLSALRSLPVDDDADAAVIRAVLSEAGQIRNAAFSAETGSS